MGSQNLIVKEDGEPQTCAIAREWDLLETPYRFHRFLTDVEDVMARHPEEAIALPLLHQLVRKLLLNSYWIQTRRPQLHEKTGVGVDNLYDEIGFPLTVQTTILAPGIKSSIHNHGTWGVIALLQGQEKNTFWKRHPHSTSEHKIVSVTERTLVAGDVISFTEGAIHSIETLGDEPLITFNIYGETHHQTRFEFDPELEKAWNY
jgi:predicted metal-dependent enzyme (double-stranded beta helix superfamily)